MLEEATAAPILSQARGSVLRDFAHAYLLTGRVDLAVALADRGAFSTAIAMFRDMGMTYWRVAEIQVVEVP